MRLVLVQCTIPSSSRMNVPITHDITSGSQRMYMHECCIANVTVDRTPALQPEVRLMHPQSTVEQLLYRLNDFELFFPEKFDNL